MIIIETKAVTRGYKIRIYPTLPQQEQINKFFNVNIAVWNLGVEIQSKRLEDELPLLKLVDLKREVKERLLDPKYKWASECGYPAHMRHFCLSDVNTAYYRYLKRLSNAPRFKRTRTTYKSFVQRNDMNQFVKRNVQINKIGTVACNVHQLERAMATSGKIVRPTISYDGLHYYFSLTVISSISAIRRATSAPIGIDLGLRDLMHMSDGTIVSSESDRVSHLVIRQKRISRKIGRLYESTSSDAKSNNLRKLERQNLEVLKRIKDIRDSVAYQAIATLIAKNPEYIAMEDLRLDLMGRTQFLSRGLSHARFRFIRDQVEYQCSVNNIPFYLVPSTYASTKTCSSCGSKNDPKTSKTYTCKECGLEIDRDYNASLNIRDYFSR